MTKTNPTITLNEATANLRTAIQQNIASSDPNALTTSVAAISIVLSGKTQRSLLLTTVLTNLSLF
jgi:hypothetical protein